MKQLNRLIKAIEKKRKNEWRKRNSDIFSMAETLFEMDNINVGEYT